MASLGDGVSAAADFDGGTDVQSVRGSGDRGRDVLCQRPTEVCRDVSFGGHTRWVQRMKCVSCAIPEDCRSFQSITRARAKARDRRGTGDSDLNCERVVGVECRDVRTIDRARTRRVRACPVALENTSRSEHQTGVQEKKKKRRISTHLSLLCVAGRRGRTRTTGCRTRSSTWSSWALRTSLSRASWTNSRTVVSRAAPTPPPASEYHFGIPLWHWLRTCPWEPPPNDGIVSRIRACLRGLSPETLSIKFAQHRSTVEKLELPRYYSECQKMGKNGTLGLSLAGLDGRGPHRVHRDDRGRESGVFLRFVSCFTHSRLSRQLQAVSSDPDYSRVFEKSQRPHTL